MAWCAVLALAFVNGALRELALVPVMGPRGALVASGLVLSLAILGVALATVRWIGPVSAGQALAAGSLWLAATLAFEFGFGALVQHRTMGEMLAAYSPDAWRAGNLWLAVLGVTWGALPLAWRVRLAAPLNPA